MFDKYFKKVFVINLDHRIEKMQAFTSQALRYNFVFERISGVNGREIPFENPLNIPHFHPGDVGCTLSHKKVAEKAKSEGLENYLVLEDDVLFRSGMDKLFPIFWQEVPSDWDLVYLGANHNNTNPSKISDKVVKVNGSYTTHAMAIKNTMYDALIEVWGRKNKPVDVLLSELHSQFNCYSLYPNLAGQRAGFSDILNKDVNYDFLLKI